MLRLLLPALMLLAACDGVDASRVAAPAARDFPPATDLPGSPGFDMARRACGRALVGAGGLMRVEFQREALGGALIMLEARRDPASQATERWRCYFDYTTRAIRAVPA